MDEKIVNGLPGARYRLIGFIRADHGIGAPDGGTLCRRGGLLGDSRPPGAALYADESVGYSTPNPTIRISAPTIAPTLHRGRVQARPRSQMVHDSTVDHRSRYLFVRPERDVELEEFTDIVGRNFKQPKEGLGWDSSLRRICGAL